jgi:hypothetical protein
MNSHIVWFVTLAMPGQSESSHLETKQPLIDSTMATTALHSSQWSNIFDPQKWCLINLFNLM